MSLVRYLEPVIMIEPRSLLGISSIAGKSIATTASPVHQQNLYSVPCRRHTGTRKSMISSQVRYPESLDTPLRIATIIPKVDCHLFKKSCATNNRRGEYLGWLLGVIYLPAHLPWFGRSVDLETLNILPSSIQTHSPSLIIE